MNNERIDISNISKGRFQLAQRKMKSIVDFDTFKTFIKTEKDNMRFWTDEEMDAFYARIEELKKENPEFKEKYDLFEQKRQKNKAIARKAVPLDDHEEAQRKILLIKARKKLREATEKSKNKKPQDEVSPITIISAKKKRFEI